MKGRCVKGIEEPHLGIGILDSICFGGKAVYFERPVTGIGGIDVGNQVV